MTQIHVYFMISNNQSTKTFLKIAVFIKLDLTRYRARSAGPLLAIGATDQVEEVQFILLGMQSRDQKIVS